MSGSNASQEPQRASAPEDTGWAGIYYGWYNLLIALSAITLVAGSTSYSFGLFIKPVSAALGLSRANTSLGLICFSVGTALASPVIGRMLDRIALVPLIRIGAVVFAITLIGLSFCSSPLLIALLMLIPLPIAATAGSLFGTVLVSRWFTRNRGRVISLMWLGSSLGGLLVFPLNAWLLSLLGWRGAIAAIGLIVGMVLILLSCLIRPHPAASTVEGEWDSTQAERHARLDWHEVLAQRDFWLIAIPISLMLAVDQTMLATMTPYTLDRGFTLAAATSLMSAMNISAIGAKFLIAAIADRTDTRLLLALTAILGVVQCACLITAPSYLGLMVVSLMTGLAIGGAMPLATIIVSKRFGASSIGTVMGLLMPINMVVGMAGLYLSGLTHDYTGSYLTAFWMFGGLNTIAILVLPFTRERPRSDSSNGMVRARIPERT